ncbi:MAG: hypothetical protein M1818_004530 [Claussenomyces sp. TS43310]|nr:MAG: hypothetical protein M1818_004530 [Claussenomyces sp. TS43310]
MTLREYLIWRLPSNSKVRRKKLSSLGHCAEGEWMLENELLGNHLDQTLIGVRGSQSVDDRQRLWKSFSQRDHVKNSTISSSDRDFDNYCHEEVQINLAVWWNGQPYVMLRLRRNFNGRRSDTSANVEQVVDFAIRLIYSREVRFGSRPRHILCQGFRSAHAVNPPDNPTSALPGPATVYPNQHVASIKSAPWPQILSLMGRAGKRIMVDLIIDCDVFTIIQTGQGNYSQLSGIPLVNQQTLCDMPGDTTKKAALQGPPVPATIKASTRSPVAPIRNPGSISFVWNRMLYAKPALNSHGKIKFGLQHMHVLNRYQSTYHSRCGSDLETRDNKSPFDRNDNKAIIHLMMYVFPRQFGLHNVFTSTVNSRETAQPFKDYTIREDEINNRYSVYTKNHAKIKVPKRLRGDTLSLIRKLQYLHERCPYVELLNYYCPPHNTGNTVGTLAAEQNRLPDHPIASAGQLNVSDYATPLPMVSAFCRSVLSRLIPEHFWGEDSVKDHNKRILMRNINSFIQLRRFESLSLHQVVQGMKINEITWLASFNVVGTRCSQTDTQKRLELFHEFVYYVFDSLLIPLVRTNFHVTESNTHRNRLFFFRHDVWRSLAEPALASLKVTMFEEIRAEEAKNILNARRLGFSRLRLLPKGSSVRPIMNLRRRAPKKGSKDMLGSSINSILAPVHSMLTYERTMNPSRFGSAMFSVGDLYVKVKNFRNHLGSKLSQPLYFAKVDVQSAFDTIPQAALLQLLSSLPQHSKYRILKHAEIKAGEPLLDTHVSSRSKPIRKWTSLAEAVDSLETFNKKLETTLAVGRNNTVWVEGTAFHARSKDELLDLLADHIKCNMVKIGKKFYRQKEGIPQGSIVSSLLCNFFYAHLEAEALSFLQTDESLLLRLIDDFLLITTKKQHAERYLQVMHEGLPQYGVNVNPRKSLVNFEASANGPNISRLIGTRKFPYCGSLIDVKTLEIGKDRGKRKAVTDSLTIEFSKMPGKTFHRKILNTFKIQFHAMFFDTSLNSLQTVLHNLYESFVESATKLWAYRKCLSPRKKPGAKLVIKTISDLLELAFILLKRKSKSARSARYDCAVTKAQVNWLAMTAFRTVLGRRQSGYREVIEHLDTRLASLQLRKFKELRRLDKIPSNSA